MQHPARPGIPTDDWRRQFYGDLGHGAKVLNLFEFRPVQAAYTENHVTGVDMYDAVRRMTIRNGGAAAFKKWQLATSCPRSL